MKAQIFTFFILISPLLGSSQKNVESTNEFVIKGLVETPKTITFADLQNKQTVEIGDFKITNHVGEFRKEYKNMKGVPLLSLLNDIKITTESPKLLSEYYLILKASDGYSVVLSWNELFNTDLGNSFFIVTEADGKSQTDSSERILMIANKDFKTGRRHIKGLQSIEIKKI
ncbi:hypothetical protein [Lacihabitans soyangensis]|uniref:Molybdopterin-binding protein n=1 Tax=Lacihabitans soyangensis TaxID=869394 RepID=A0AAE3KV94_9BACT|nr:hypothetical protein [Lacihabitans soyangensis]MCP9763956.1 molybdopterin-binding protein [Lacihabitans soyangensis]